MSAERTPLQESRAYIEHRLGWRIIGDTFRVVDEKNAIWVARVSAQGQPGPFTVLVKGKKFFDLDDPELDVTVEALAVSQAVARQNGPSQS